MKKFIFSGTLLAGLYLLPACADLDVDVESELTPANFPKTPDQLIAATGPLYSQLSAANGSNGGNSYATNYWRLQELSTDAAIMPARGGNFDDGGQYRFLHKHTWNLDHPTVRNVWEWGFGGINIANRLLATFEGAPENAAKRETIAQVRTMRALFYFYMMDLYGNVPIVKNFGEAGLPPTAPRAEVFAYVESELKEAIPNLSETTGTLTYGRPTKFLAFALLAKMYLNAEYYLNQPRYPEAVAMADNILTSNRYVLSTDYSAIFRPDNGPAITETIFAAVYDANLIKGNAMTRWTLNQGLAAKFGVTYVASNIMSTLPDFYYKFNLAGDVRNDTWVAGKQFNLDGTPILIRTTNRGLNQTYSGPDPAAAINWHLDLTPVILLENEATMDTGNDLQSQTQGARSIKYFPDPNASTDRYQNNDMPVFRLADVLLMKAEAILRGAPATAVNGELQTPLVLVNKLRTRAKAPLATSIDLNELLDERARELSWEGWRRNDLIRYGQFEQKWGFKDNADVTRRIYPVLASELSLNPGLRQNPGY
ncbi:MAG: RagB/SusD family nutrient uptake outer membrane protein [Ferruginibacter sp.]|nr:RagB/SusD family nutrient uptake outer membrane protein [Cytophagales bacterium]